MFFGEKMKTKNLTLVVIGSTCGTFLKLAFERIADWDEREKERKKERKREREREKEKEQLASNKTLFDSF